MMALVLVCVPAGEGNLIEPRETTPLPDKDRPEPVGFLTGFEAAEDGEAVGRDLGTPVQYHVRSVKAKNGCRGALLSMAVEVPRYEDAVALPGFVPLGYWTGAFYEMPKNEKQIVLTHLDDVFEGHSIKRLSIADHYDDFEPPPYEENGAYHLSLVRLGQIGGYVFLKEDPLHFYAVPWMSYSSNHEERIAWIRRFVEKCRN
jgi:hypothetical protein